MTNTTQKAQITYQLPNTIIKLVELLAPPAAWI
jgi:hypothetical protein